jgi:hypothetical protein
LKTCLSVGTLDIIIQRILEFKLKEKIKIAYRALSLDHGATTVPMGSALVASMSTFRIIWFIHN